LAGGLAAAGPAYSQLWTGAATADDLQYRLGVIDAELADIRARLGVAPSAGGGAGGGAGSRAGGAGSDAILRLDKLEAELRLLTGKIEQMQFEQRGVADDAARRFGDIEFRLTELEGGDASALPPVLPLGGGAPAPVDAGPAVSISERGDLDRAIEDVKQGRFDQGEDRLPGFNTDRTGATAPKNLYRLGVTLGRLGQLSEACLTLREVRKQFPTGPSDILDATDAESRALNCG
jgi:TolA-binding protein